jgi:exodeoxyribonuclease V alpha subunit
MTRPTLHETLAALAAACEAGALRRLDLALARYLCAQQLEAPPELALAVAWLAQHEGQGHVCWPLAAGVQARRETAGPALTALLQRLPAQAAHWCNTLRGCTVVDAAATAITGSAPLVLHGERLYLRRYWQHERHLVSALVDRAAQAADLRPADGEVQAGPASVRTWLDRLFGPVPAHADADPAAVDWQRAACAAALRARLTIVTGGPGTGKTYTAARVLALLFATAPQPEHLRVALAAPTGKAAARLGQAIEQAWSSLAGQLSQEFAEDLGDQSAPESADQPAEAAAMQRWGGRIGPARTLHALLGARPLSRAWRHDARHPLALDVLVVDEASMVHLEMMSALLAALPPGARLILLGDKDQLASVEAGAVLADLCAGAEAGGYTPHTADALAALTGQRLPASMLGAGSALAQQTVMLRRSRRFGGPIGALAQAVNAGDAAAAWRCLQAGDPSLCLLEPAGQAGLLFDDTGSAEAGGVAETVEATEGEPSLLPLHRRLLQRLLDGARPGKGLRAVYTLVQQGPAAPGTQAHAAWVRAVLQGFEASRVLAALRGGPWGVGGVNGLIESALRDAGLLPAGPRVASGGWYAGRPVIVTRNDAAAGVFNGDVGLALPGPLGEARAPGAGLRVWFLDGDALRSVRPARLSQVETAFAMTVHKSQGSEFGHTLLVLPPQAGPVLTRELLYTGITRARDALTLVLPSRAAFDAALQRRTERDGGLLAALSRPTPSPPQ